MPPTRDHLLEIGLNRIRACGYTATGIQDILQEAKVPKGSFYHYFPSKEAFTAEVLGLYVQREEERLRRVLSDSSHPPLKRLRKYFEELIRTYGPQAAVSGCLLGNLTLEIAGHSERIQGLLHQSFAGWQSAITALLREAVRSGHLPSSTKPGDLAAFLLNSYQGALLRSKADQSSKPFEQFLYFTFQVLLKPPV